MKKFVYLILVLFVFETSTTAIAQEGNKTIEDPVFQKLETYLGLWVADERETPEGEKYRFLYRLSYFDPKHTIIDMEILRQHEEGQVDLLWRGVKGWDGATSTVYYQATSPEGRSAQGLLYIDEKDNLVTEYKGMSATGPSVLIRDQFTRNNDDSFLALTFLSLDNGETWRQVWKDEWTRVK